MKLFLCILLSLLTGLTGGFYGERYFVARIVPPMATRGAKPLTGRLRVYQIDGSTYGLDCSGLMTIRQNDGTDPRKGVRIHLEVKNTEQCMNELAQRGQATFGAVQGFVSDDPKDGQ